MHIKVRHDQVEHCKCVENGCSSKFIRRGYVSRHLVWTHSYSRSDAREAALTAPRGDRPNQHGGLEDISDDDTILDLLAERDKTANVQDYLDKSDGFDTDLLVNDVDDILDGFSIHGDVDDGAVSAHGDVNDDAVSVQDDVNGDVSVNDSADNDGDVSVQDDVNGDVSVNDSDDDGDMDNNIDDIIVISRDDDHSADDVGTVAVSNSRTVIEALVLTFYRTRHYFNGCVVNSSVSMEKQYGKDRMEISNIFSWWECRKWQLS